MNQNVFNDRLRQVVVLILLILMVGLLVSQLSIFLPGILGGITFYILSRSLYMQLIFRKKWKKGWTALLFIIGLIVIIAIPIYFTVTLISPKINSLAANQEKIVTGIETISSKVSERFGIELLTPENARNLTQKISSFIPMILNSTATVLTNLIMMFFLFYYLLVSGRDTEKALSKIIPLKPRNIGILASETKMMIKANALGIPIICVIQGMFAALGYWIFGLDDWALWGFVTGIFAFFPLVGTMIIWVPLVAYLFAQGLTWPAIGLMIYSVIVTGNVDYVARLGLMKRMGDVHPVITVLGVIVGLKLFGFIGLIFGPLLISYFLIMVKIYINEFGDEHGNLDQNPNPPGLKKN